MSSDSAAILSSLPRDDPHRGRSGPGQKTSQHPRHPSTHRRHEANHGREDVHYGAQARAQPPQGQQADHSKGKMPTPAFTINFVPPPGFDHMGPLFSSAEGILVEAPNPGLISSTLGFTPANDLRQVPGHSDGCAQSATNDHDINLPHSPPPPSQPPSGKEHVPKPSIVHDLTTQARISKLDKDTQTLVTKYGGCPVENQMQVLDKVEEWEARNRQSLMTVVRKDGLKGGVVHVTCNACLLIKPEPPEEARHKTVQKAAEHIISFHWELSIWACVVPGCDKKFRRKQECDRHEETHGIMTKKKEKRLASQTEAPLPTPDKAVPTEKSALHRSRSKRNEPKDTLLVPPGSVSGGPERSSRSRDSSPHRQKPYDNNLRPSRSSPDLSTVTVTAQPSTSRPQNIPYLQRENPSSYQLPPSTAPNPAPRLTLTDTSGGSSQLYSPSTAVNHSLTSMQFAANQNIQAHSRRAAAPPPSLSYHQFPSYFLFQGQHVAQVRSTPSSSGTMHPQGQAMPSTYGSTPSYGLPLMGSYEMPTSQLNPNLYAAPFDVGTAGAGQIPPQSMPIYDPNEYARWLQQSNYE